MVCEELNLNLIYHVHFGPKDSKHYRISTPKIIAIWECLEHISFALSHAYGSVLKS
jgi:hypothetical protein